MTQNQIQNPLLAAWDAMNKDQKAAHLEKHAEIIKQSVELFEDLNGYSMHVLADSVFGQSVSYAVRCGEVNGRLAVDRRYTLETQMKFAALVMKDVADRFNEWQMKKELEELLKMHGVTEDRKV